MRKDFGNLREKMDSPDEDGFTQLDRDIDDIYTKLHELLDEMDRDFGDERTYKGWLRMVSHQGALADFILQLMEDGEYGN